MSNYVTIGFSDEEAGNRFFTAVGKILDLGDAYPSTVFAVDTIALLHRHSVNGLVLRHHVIVERETRNTIVEVLCSQALADHLGDVRNAEVTLWRLLGVDPKDIVNDYDSAWQNTRTTLKKHDIPLPNYLKEDNDG